MRKVIFMAFLINVLLLSACTTDNDQDARDESGQNTDMIQYESKTERKDRLTDDEKKPDYGTHEEKRRINSGNEGDEYSDLFTTKESKEINEELRRHRAVRQAQVAIKDDEVVVGVMLATGYNNDICDQIKSEVQAMMPEKTVTVYTDARYLNSMDDINAKRNKSDIDDYIKEYLENFFNE